MSKPKAINRNKLVAFAYCTSLTSDIIFPESVELIADKAFKGAAKKDNGVLKVYVTNPTCVLWMGDPFNQTNSQKFFAIHTKETTGGSFTVSAVNEADCETINGLAYVKYDTDALITITPDEGKSVDQVTVRKGYAEGNEEQLTITKDPNSDNKYIFHMRMTAIGGATAAVTFKDIVHNIDVDCSEILIRADGDYSSSGSEATIRNKGNEPEALSVDTTGLQYFNVWFDQGKSVVNPGDLTDLKVTPKEGLDEGTYEESIILTTASGISKNIALKFVLYPELVVTASSDVSILKGTGTTVSIEITGGRGEYSLNWYDGDRFYSGTEIYVTPTADTTKYGYTVNDGVKTVEGAITVTLRDEPWLLGITAPDAVRTESGVEKTAEALGLPKTAAIETEVADITTAEVEWNVSDADYDPDILTEQIFTVQGTVILPDGVDANGHDLTISVNVTAAAAPFVEAVTADTEEGTYTENRSITLETLTEGADIYYTMDGSEPNRTNGILYADAIELPGIHGVKVTTTIRATAVKAGMQDSEETSFTYTIELPAYEITDGTGSELKAGSDEALTIRGTGELAKFVEARVDDKTVDPKNYELRSGSTIITFNPEFLQTLEAGKHTCELVWTDGIAAAVFTVLKAEEKPSENPSGKPSENPSGKPSGKPASEGTDHKTAGGTPISALKGTSGTPETGDPPQGLWWLLIMAGAAYVMTECVVKRNKHKN